MIQTIQQWKDNLADKAFAEGKHVPSSWRTEYDSGEDGCMPKGWYLIGCCKNGFPIDHPIRHEYGPFDTKAEAKSYSDFVMAVVYSITPCT